MIFRNKSTFTPYISAEISFANLKHKTGYKYSELDTNGNYIDNSINQFSKYKTQNNFAWNLGLGIQYVISADFSGDLSYRYLNAGKSTISNIYDGQTQKSKFNLMTLCLG